MFSDLAVLYLLLGGAGAGTLAVCCVLDLTLVRQPFGFAAGYAPGPSANARERTIDFAFLLGFAFLIVGVACLMADLGRLDRVMSLFASPHPTALTVGSYSLAALLALGAGLALVRFMYLPDVPQVVVRIAEAAAFLVALVVMGYTGVLLQGIGGVALWSTPLIPALFVLSSLSCGAAAVFFISPFSGVADEAQMRMLKALARFDAAVIILEAVAAASFLLWAASSEHPAVAASLSILIRGEMAYAWWVGFVACGLVVPLAVELALIWRKRSDLARKALAVVAALVLAGALSMRFAIVDSGVHRALELQDAGISVSSDASTE